MAPSVVDLKKKKQDGGRVWVCWSVLYGNGHTSFRKSASTPVRFSNYFVNHFLIINVIGKT